MGVYSDRIIGGDALERALRELNSREATMADVDGLLPPPSSVDVSREVVKVILATDIETLNVSGLPVSLYLDGSDTPSEVKTADEDGVVVFTIAQGTPYRLSFTQVEGLDDVPDVEHRALMVWRGIEVMYADRHEQVTVTVTDRNEVGTTTALQDWPVTFAVTPPGGTATTQVVTTDAKGKAVLSIKYGYTVKVSVPAKYERYIRGGNERELTFVAGTPTRTVAFDYRYIDSGLKFVMRDGSLMSIEQMSAATEAGTVELTDARYIAIFAEELQNEDSCFAFSIDDMVNRNYVSAQWGLSGTLVTTIPANGNVVGSDYYYDGLGACRAIRQWAEDNNKSKQLICDTVLNEDYTIGGEVHEQFIGSIGQWNVLWNNRTLIDEMLMMVRPDAKYLLSTYTTQKWSSTQSTASFAWGWGSSASNNNKNNGYAVVPFFAY